MAGVDVGVMMELLRVRRVRVGSALVYGWAASVFVGLVAAAALLVSWAFLDRLTLFDLLCDQARQIGLVEAGGCPLLGVSVAGPAAAVWALLSAAGAVAWTLLVFAFNLLAELTGGVKVEVERMSDDA